MADIFLVVGYPRSGTSMMMRCLEAGGMDAIYSPRKGELELNPYGCYEVSKEEYDNFSFLGTVKYEGKLIKVNPNFLAKWNSNHDKFNYRAVFMIRRFEPALKSCQATGQKGMPGLLSSNYYKHLAQDIRRWEQFMQGYRLTIFDMMDVVDDPMRAFNNLKNNGWPIVSLKNAAAMVEREHVHYE